jgi:hypothetical protein
MQIFFCEHEWITNRPLTQKGAIRRLFGRDCRFYGQVSGPKAVAGAVRALVLG